jgi:hypothetical protein
VIDSGINQDHKHFAENQTISHPSVAQLHRDFTGVAGSVPTKDLWPWHSRRGNHCGSHDPQQGEASCGLSTHLRD